MASIQPGQPLSAFLTQQQFGQGVQTISSGSNVVIDMRGMSQFSVITDFQCILSASRVNSDSASAFITGSSTTLTFPTASCTTTTIDWPFYYFMSVTGSARIAVL